MNDSPAEPSRDVRAGRAEDDQALVRLVRERMRNTAPGIPMEDVMAGFLDG